MEQSGAMTILLHGTVLVSIVAGLPLTWRALRGRREPEPGRVRWYGHPGWWLTIVTSLLLVNQVLFTIYALKARHGDLSYLSRHVPRGWFVLADGPAMTWLADHWPAPPLLALSAMRIPSLLELPFGILAYLTLLNWLDPRLYRRLTATPVLALTAASWSITFGLIEWALHTPYTWQNLALRAVSCVVTVVALRRLVRLPSAPPAVAPPRTPGELFAYASSAAALGYLVLALYDSVLLSSLGKVAGHLPGAAVAAVVLLLSRYESTRLRAHEAGPAGPTLDTLVTGLSWWLALFLVPALAIRYELGFGSRPLAAAAGLLVIAAATAAALREVYARLPDPRAPGRWLLGLVVAVLAAAAAAGTGLRVPADHQELRLLWAAALFVLAATLVCAAWDRLSTTGR
jgi:hypothetical protein